MTGNRSILRIQRFVDLVPQIVEVGARDRIGRLLLRNREHSVERLHFLARQRSYVGWGAFRR